jgi:hypothetical protein
VGVGEPIVVTACHVVWVDEPDVVTACHVVRVDDPRPPMRERANREKDPHDGENRTQDRHIRPRPPGGPPHERRNDDVVRVALSHVAANVHALDVVAAERIVAGLIRQADAAAGTTGKK